MKKIKKQTAIFLITLFSLIIVLGGIFSFVPINFGNKIWTTFSKNVSISSDIRGGIYGEYEIKTEDASKSDIIDSMGLIREVFDENGYKNVNVYAIGNKKIRIEVGYPNGVLSFSDAYSNLSNVGSGAFYLASSTTVEGSNYVVQGSTCVEKLNVYTSNDNKVLSVKFNESGKQAFKELCESGSSTCYIIFGEQYYSLNMQTNQDDYSQLVLTNNDYEDLISLEQRIKFGCMKVELNSDNVKIDTMSASLSMAESSSSPASSSFFSSSVYVVLVSLTIVVAMLLIVLFAVKFGYFAILILVTMLINLPLFLLLMCLIPSIELGLSGFVCLAVCIAFSYTYTYIFASNVKKEYEIGRTVNASIENAMKTHFATVLFTNISVFFASLILFALSFGEIMGVAIMISICMALSMLTNLLIVPLLIKIVFSLNQKLVYKLFMLKKREITSLAKDKEVE